SAVLQHGCDVVRGALQTVPCGDRRNARSGGQLWRTGGVPFGTDGIWSTYARPRSSSTPFRLHQIAPPSRRCRTVPRGGVVHARGPASGRVGAKRRAWTTPSTAPASSARWWRVTIGTQAVVVFYRTTRLVREPIPAKTPV